MGYGHRAIDLTRLPTPQWQEALADLEGTDSWPKAAGSTHTGSLMKRSEPCAHASTISGVQPTRNANPQREPLLSDHRASENYDQALSEQGHHPAIRRNHSQHRETQDPESRHQRARLHSSSSSSEPPGSPHRRLPYLALEIERRRIRHSIIPRPRATCPPTDVHSISRTPAQPQRPTPMPPSVLHTAQASLQRIPEGKQPRPPDQSITRAPSGSLHKEI